MMQPRRQRNTRKDNGQIPKHALTMNRTAMQGSIEHVLALVRAYECMKLLTYSIHRAQWMYIDAIDE